MRLLVMTLLVLLVAVGLGIAARYEPGSVVVGYGSWTVQMSLAFFVTALALGFFLLYMVLRLLAQLWGVPQRLHLWAQGRRKRSAEKALFRGLIALSEGDWRLAEKTLTHALPESEKAVIYYLAAARAAQKQNALDRRDSYLRLAHDSMPEADIAVGLTQAELQIRQRQMEQALATLTHLRSVKPNHAYVLWMLMRLYREMQDWDGLLALLPELSRRHVVSAEKRKGQELEAYTALLQCAVQTPTVESPDAVWARVPRSLRQEANLLQAYVEEKLKLSDTTRCERLVREALHHEWHSSLVRLYGLIEGKDEAKQLAHAETWLESHGKDPVLLVTIGRLCMRNALWGRARSYLEASINLQASPESYRLLADLLEQMGEPAAAALCYREGLVLATGENKSEPQAGLLGDSPNQSTPHRIASEATSGSSPA